MLRATAAWHFGTSELPKWLRQCGVLCILTCKCASRACHFSTSELQKWLRDRQFVCIFTCKCASRHSGVPFFNIGTSKSVTTPSVFYHFHLQMCFSPQLRAIFRVPFFTCPRNSYLRTRRFSEPTFRTSGTTIH